MDRTAEQLVAAGLSPNQAEHKGPMLNACRSVVNGDVSLFVPGRIEILGKHTDYAGGRSLLCAAERGMCIAAKKRTDGMVRISDAKAGDSIEFSIHEDIATPARGWGIYPITVFKRLLRNFPGSLSGADIAFASDLPRASGMSSSSVLVTAIFTVVSTLNNLTQRPEYTTSIRGREDLAGYLGCVENGQTFDSLVGDAGVGTFGGSEDHTAILCCRNGWVSQYGFCPVRHERDVRLPEDFIWVIGTSGVSAAKTGNANARYNYLSRSVAEILKAWNSRTNNSHASLAEAVRSSPDAPTRICAVLDQVPEAEFPRDLLLQRFQQFVLESEKIIPSAADALQRCDWKSFGELAAESQLGAERMLRNQTDETVGLVRLARQLGAVAASAFGAGFGGSVWALVERRKAKGFTQVWRDAYASAFASAAPRSEFFLTQAGPGLVVL